MLEQPSSIGRGSKTPVPWEVHNKILPPFTEFRYYL